MIRRRFRRRPFFVVYVARQAAARGVPLLDDSEGHEQLNENGDWFVPHWSTTDAGDVNFRGWQNSGPGASDGAAKFGAWDSDFA